MRIPAFLSAAAFTMCSALFSQSAPIQEGHDVIVTSEWGERLGFLGLNGVFEAGPTMGQAQDVAYDPTSDTIFLMNDDVFAYDGPDLYAYNPHTLQQTYIGDLDLGVDGSVLACHPGTGELYYLNWGSTKLYHLDKQTAALTLIGSGAPARVYRGAAFHPQTHELYAVQSPIGSLAATLVVIDVATGASTVLTQVDRNVRSLTFDQQGGLIGLVGILPLGGPFDLVGISLTTGQTQVITTYPSGLSLGGLSIMPATSPTLTLSSSTPIGGQTFFVAVTGAKADAHTWLGWSLTGAGSTVVPQLGITLGLASPIGSGPPLVSRLDGRLMHTVTLPQLIGVQVWVQAMQMDLVSNVETFTIQ